ncbi:MarR family winged helix-turn-helix transcriptional regulator [Pseudonocardia kujensis]|uniref:MarR family winged helix-turn-helix transcriptional regulator n=1 Tax=Pseudonocardia kujensis TaxID=1128675 RepID=UPI001E306DBC|nr:MarR family winged helix-turn-helix transcriptional regulator [Pseudonocardia kujensis]MCE0766426.1 MarR family winged helix-turn-helix transcriptional regulator [Pseudonocardia kujensis]
MAEQPLDRLLITTGATLARFRRRVVAAHGLSATALDLLTVLTGEDGLPHRELAGRLGLTPATLTPVVDALEREGAVRRDRDAADRRVVRVCLTENGWRRCTTVADQVDRTLRETVPDERPEVRHYLDEVLAAVEGRLT